MPVTHPNASPTLDVLFQRILARQPDALALLDPAQQAARHRPAAEAPDLRPGRPRDLGARGAFHRIRPAGQFRDRGAIAEYGRVRADGACRAPRRPGRRGVAAAVAAGGIDRRAQPHRRPRRRHHEPDRRRRSRRHRHECRGGMLFDPPCLRLWRRSAGRHGLARPGDMQRPPPPRARSFRTAARPRWSRST